VTLFYLYKYFFAIVVHRNAQCVLCKAIIY